MKREERTKQRITIEFRGEKIKRQFSNIIQKGHNINKKRDY